MTAKEQFMPIKLNAKLPADNADARIEIIPLIDIMFFLLAAFMLVSLSMVNLKSIKVNLPTATTSEPQSQRDMLDISVNKSGSVFLDKKPVGDAELATALATSKRSNPNVRIFISGDRDTRHGDIIHVLDVVRSAGIDRIAFEIRQPRKDVNP
jgi:biopolymer transport protein ExbD